MAHLYFPFLAAPPKLKLNEQIGNYQGLLAYYQPSPPDVSDLFV